MDDKKAVIDRLMNSNVEDNVSILSILPVGHLLCFSSHKQSITEYIYGQKMRFLVPKYKAHL